MKFFRKFYIALSIILVLTGCAEIQQRTQDPSKELNLARSPIGLHVQKIGNGSGMTYTDITVRNNSGEFIKHLYIEVLAYDNENRVGMTNHNFNSINVGEMMIIRNPINSSGRPWNSWKYTYKIIK